MFAGIGEKVTSLRQKIASSDKRIFGLFITLLVLIALPVMVFVTQQRQQLSQHAASPSISPSQSYDLNKDFKETSIPGEILVKFKTTPSIKIKEDALSQGMDLERTAVPLSSVEENTLPSGLKSLNQKYKIKKIEKIFKKSFAQKALKEEKSDLSKQYKLELESAVPVQSAIEELKKDPQVEYAEPNYIVKAQAVPNDQYYPQMWNLSKIQMDKAWDITKGSSAVTVAVLDTGIDYTHPELGESKVTDRTFDRITDSLSLYPGNRFLDFDQTFAINKNRLAYPSNNKIYIYSFDTKTTDTVNLFADNLYVIKLALQDDILAYAAEDSDSNTGYYFYNLKTNEHKKIADTQIVGSISIGNGKVVYAKENSIYTYDIQTGIETPTPIESLSNSGASPVTSGNQIIYSVSGDNCYDKANIYNMDDNSTKSIYPPDIGPILDFKNNKILYVACNKTNPDYTWKTYYIYDIVSGKSYKLSYNPDYDSIFGTKTNIRLQGGGPSLSIYSWISKGVFGDEVVFFSKDISANRIIAFDQTNSRYVQINLFKNSHTIAAEGKRVCFLSDDISIYCHTYDASTSYPLPDNVFNNRVVNGYNFADNSNNPYDGYGHGTHVAGTIGALTNNSIGVSGINWDIKLMAVKVLSDSGSGSTYNVARGVVYASDNGAKIINMSLGGPYPCTSSQTFQDAISYARNAGVTVVVSAGNYNMDASNFSPASCNGVITVASTGPDDTTAYYSNYGSVVDLAAPGGDSSKCSDNSSCLINSTFPNDQYRFLQGTSMASPHVAGVAALLLTKNSFLTPDQIETILKDNGDAIPTDQPIGKRLNAYKSLLAVPSGNLPCGTIGDVNLDGKIGIVDSQMVLRSLVGSQTFTDEQKKRADVSGDGKIGTADSILIQRYIVKLITTFPACPKY